MRIIDRVARAIALTALVVSFVAFSNGSFRSWAFITPPVDSGAGGGEANAIETAGDYLTITAEDIDLDVEAVTEENCIYLESPDDADDLQSFWRAPVALNITEIWCEGDNANGSALDLQIDDGSPADVAGADLDCDDTPATDNTGLTGTMAAGDRLDMVMTAANDNTWLAVCWKTVKVD